MRHVFFYLLHQQFNQYYDKSLQCILTPFIQVIKLKTPKTKNVDKKCKKGLSKKTTCLRGLKAARPYKAAQPKLIQAMSRSSTRDRDKISVFIERHPRANRNTQLTSTQELVKIHNICGYKIMIINSKTTNMTLLVIH